MKEKISQIIGYFNAFLTWWFGELSSIIPLRIKDFFDDKDNNNWLEVSSKGVNVIYFNENEKREAHFDGNGLAVLRDQGFGEYLRENLAGFVSVRLSDDFILEREHLIPLAAKNSFRDVIKFELPQLLPMEMHSIYFDCNLVDVKDKSDFACVQIAMIRKRLADEIIVPLESYGLSLKKLVSFPRGETKMMSNFLNFETHYKKKNQKIIGGLFASFTVLSISLAWTILNYFENREEFLNTELVRLSHHVSEITSLKNSIDLYQTKENLHNEKITKIKFDQLLEILTNAFPNDSWVFEYNQSDSKITLTGISLDTSRLLERLTENEIFRNININSNSMDNGQGQRVERFTISMDLDETIVSNGGGRVE